MAEINTAVPMNHHACELQHEIIMTIIET